MVCLVGVRKVNLLANVLAESISSFYHLHCACAQPYTLAYCSFTYSFSIAVYKKIEKERFE